jgi:membrane protein DedA with SNARE-associated domain
MPWKRFFVYDLAGATIWGIGNALVGYLLGESYERWERYATPVGLALLAVLVLLILGSKLLASRRKVREEFQEIEAEVEQEADLASQRERESD